MMILWRCKVGKSIRDLTVKSDSGCKVSPGVIFAVKSLIKCLTFHLHKMSITSASSLKTCK